MRCNSTQYVYLFYYSLWRVCQCSVHIPYPRGCFLKQNGILESEPDLIIYFLKLQSASFFLVFFRFQFCWFIFCLFRFAVFFLIVYYAYCSSFFSNSVNNELFILNLFSSFHWFQGCVVPNIHVQILLLYYFCKVSTNHS